MIFIWFIFGYNEHFYRLIAKYAFDDDGIVQSQI
jgi:hypothetical protein